MPKGVSQTYTAERRSQVAVGVWAALCADERSERARAKMPSVRTCERCGAGCRHNAKFCSRKCRRKAHPEPINTESRQRSRDVFSAKHPNYGKERYNRPGGRERGSATYARRRGAEQLQVTEKDWARLVARYGGLCAYCQERPWSHRDHIIPLARGGRHSIGNLLPACAPCNHSKGSKTLAEWRAWKTQKAAA